MKFLIALAFIAAVSALAPNTITGPTPPPVPCPDSLCHGRADGNYNYKHGYYGKGNDHYFVQCVDGKASCQACWPLSLFFVERCNQCLYSKHDKCATTQKWEPATTFFCPDKCPSRGPHFSGNIKDDHNPHQYVGCWKGVTVGCVACPAGLKFNEKWNACLYNGKHDKVPTKRPHDPYNPYA